MVGNRPTWLLTSYGCFLDHKRKILPQALREIERERPGLVRDEKERGEVAAQAARNREEEEKLHQEAEEKARQEEAAAEAERL